LRFRGHVRGGTRRTPPRHRFHRRGRPARRHRTWRRNGERQQS
jgi:hypothetical protein